MRLVTSLAHPLLLPPCLAALLLSCVGSFATAEPTAPEPSSLKIAVDFDGGSAHIVDIDQHRRLVRIRPQILNQRGWRCWWFFKLNGIVPGESITLEVGDAPWATPDRATFSLDGKTWLQTDLGKRQGQRIVFQQTIQSKTAWFAWGPPFTQTDAEELVQWATEECSEAKKFVLCKSQRGRDVPALHFTPSGDAALPRVGIWINARQHAWEVGSSWVCKGLIEWFVSNDPRAIQVRQAADMTVVPIMDVDSVAIGAGGKNQLPHDHNRDWGKANLYQSVSAAMQHIRQLDDQRLLKLYIDLHNPGAHCQSPFFYVAPHHILSDIGQRNLNRFLATATNELSGPLKFRGECHESGPNYDQNWQRISKNWVTLNTREDVVAITLETPWNTIHSNVDGYRLIGNQLGRTIARYLQVMKGQAQ